MLDLVVIPGPSFRHFLPPPLLCSALRLLTRATFCKSEGRITHLSPLHRLASLAVLIEKMAFTQNCVSAAGMAVVRALPLCLALRNPLFPFLGGTQGHRSTIPGLFFYLDERGSTSLESIVCFERMRREIAFPLVMLRHSSPHPSRSSAFLD